MSAESVIGLLVIGMAIVAVVGAIIADARVQAAYERERDAATVRLIQQVCRAMHGAIR